MVLMQVIDNKKPPVGMSEKSGLKVGFVHHNGALHQGHLKLVEKSEAGNQRIVDRILINPTQFNNPDDLKTIH